MLQKFVGYTLKNKKIKEYVGKEEIFQGYRYRQRKITTNPNTGKQLVWQPYIKKKDSSNHAFALTFDKWGEIIDDYFQVVADLCMEGHDIELPKGLGLIRLVRKKGKAKVRGNKIFRNLHTFGFKPRVVWLRKRDATFYHKFWFGFNFSRKIIWSRISKLLHAKPETIYKFPEYTD